MGRRRQYCRQSCRQRAYEQRASINGVRQGASLPADAVVLSADEAADLSDRVYQVRCAAEDVATALDEGAGATELRELCDCADAGRQRPPTAGAESACLTARLTMRLTIGPMGSRVQSRHGWLGRRNWVQRDPAASHPAGKSLRTTPFSV